MAWKDPPAAVYASSLRQSSLPCTGRERKPRLSPPSRWQMAGEEMPERLGPLSCQGKVPDCVRATRTEAPRRRTLPVWGRTASPGEARGPCPLGEQPGYFPTAVAQGRSTQAPGTLTFGLGRQLSSTSWHLDEPRKTGRGHLQVPR